MNKSDFLEPENEKLMQFLTKTYEKERLSGQIKEMVADKVKSTDFSKFNIPDSKFLFRYKNTFLNSMLILLGAGLLVALMYNYNKTTTVSTVNQNKTDATVNSHYDNYEVNKLIEKNEPTKLKNSNKQKNIESKILIKKNNHIAETTVSNTETIVNSSVQINIDNFKDLSVIKNEIVNIIKELNLKQIELVQNDKLFLIESKSSIGYLNDIGSDVKFRLKFFISKNEQSKLKIDLIYENVSSVSKPNIDVNELFYHTLKNKIANMINKYN